MKFLNLFLVKLAEIAGMTPTFSHIPNLDMAALESAVREQEIDGESLLLLTQVRAHHLVSFQRSLICDRQRDFSLCKKERLGPFT